MLFNSYEFLFFFLPFVLGGYFVLARASTKAAALWLAASSLFFYGWWNPRFVALLLGSVCVNFLFGQGIARVHSRDVSARNLVLYAAIVLNLLLLGYYKYVNFFIDTSNALFDLRWSLAQDIALPLGISFFTFTQIAYLVDISRGYPRESNFTHYVLFVSYFPHLIAGPVLHHAQLMPQFSLPEVYRPSLKNFSIGATYLSLGLFKKVVLADEFAVYANPVFDSAALGGQPQIIEAWIGALAYALQLYFDFSAYSDMAIGISKMLNVDLPVNFNSPYRATSIIEFWRRWHMTLSAFLKDYLYIPLGGNRMGKSRRYMNLMATMILGGLWHGANWTFVLWGLLHGLYLVANHLWRSFSRGMNFKSLPAGLGCAITFAAVVAAWIPFRSADVSSALHLLRGLFGFNGISLPKSFEGHAGFLSSAGVSFDGAVPSGAFGYDAVLYLLIGLSIVFVLPNTGNWIESGERSKPKEGLSRLLVWRPNATRGFLVAMGFVAAVTAFSTASPFLYFQF